jgi:hypothetical protein
VRNRVSVVAGRLRPVGADTREGRNVSGFGAWLAQFTQVSSAIGDLARDAAADEDWPEGPDELETYADHLESAGASEAALETLADAWARYAASR